MAEPFAILPESAMIDLRGRAADPVFNRAIETVLGLAPPVAPNTMVSVGSRDLLWLGPDEWLLIEPGGNGPALEAALMASPAGQLAAACDVSGNRIRMVIDGPHALSLLSRGCPLDLSAMLPGSCAQTLMARAQVILIRRGPDCFELLLRRSFAGYMCDWLTAAAAGLRRAA